MTTESAAPAPAPARPVAADRVVTAHLWLSLLFLALGLAGALLAALQLIWPDTLGGVAVLSYGRVVPAVNNLLLFGWLAIGLFGAAYHVVGRTFGMPVWGGSVPLVSLLLVAGGLAAGVAAVLAGGMEGRELGELPLWADVVVAAGLLGGAYSATRTADPATRRVAPPAVWFALGGMWWTALAFVVANVPGLMGVNVEIQSAFATGALLFGGLPALGIAVAYHFVAGLPAAEDDEGALAEGDPDQLARIGFWTLLFVAGWLGPALIVHSPAPGWLQTVGVAFAILYVLPVLAIVTDLLRRVQGRWDAAAGLTGMRFLAVAVGALPVLALANVAQSLRASGSVVGFTPWWEGVLFLAAFGVLGAFLFGFAHLTAGPPRRAARWHFGLTLAGAAVAVTASWAAGLHAGYTWVGTSNSGELVDAGLAFRNGVEPLAAWFEWRAAGMAVLLAAQLVLAAGLLRHRSPAPGVEPAPVTPDPVPDDADAEGAAAPQPLRVAVQGALGLFMVAVLAMVIVPSLEQANREATLRGETRDFAPGSAEARGQAIYVQEGCVYCHTQQVRPVIADVGLGPVSQPGDYADLSEPLLGLRRLGPDLMHAGAREPTDSVRWVRDHLADPYLDRPWSVMPSYDYLSSEDLQALAQYVAALD